MKENFQRFRRLRASPAMRQLAQEHHVQREDLIWPIFVSEKITARQEVLSMPGVFQWTAQEAAREARAAFDQGLPAILLFGVPAQKDEIASCAYASSGIVQRAIAEIKKAAPELLVITDLCLCEYMSHGHCGIVENGVVLNDPTLELLAKTAVSHAEAGADMVAPSDMMDGRIQTIRLALDDRGFQQTPIMSYAAKFASACYGPFRDAAESAPEFGDRRGYQMNPANAEEALREIAADIEEGADWILVKPGLNYLDILWRAKQRFQMPTAAYQVSGEYSMLKAAAAKGWLDEKTVMQEQLLAFKRAGADAIVTYWAREALQCGG